MSMWNDKREGEVQIPCPVCGTMVKKKRRTYHLTSCYEKHKECLAELGLLKCPLNRLHVIPIVHLNHHLEGNCEEAQNSLRRYFHRPELRVEMVDPPASFLSEYPDEVLNFHNKKLLYLLKKDLSGRDIANNKDIYPDPPQPQAAGADRTAEAQPPPPPPTPPAEAASDSAQAPASESNSAPDPVSDSAPAPVSAQ